MQITFFDIPPWACPLCKNENTHVEKRNWTYVNGKLVTIPSYKTLVCSHCRNSEGEGYAFGYVDRNDYVRTKRGWELK